MDRNEKSELNEDHATGSRSVGLVLGARIDAMTWEHALSRMEAWAARRESRYVCVCNAHSVVTTRQDEGFRRVVNEADMATPDGMPVVWMLRRLGFSWQQRITGADLMDRYCDKAARRGAAVYLYGGRPEAVAALKEGLSARHPGLMIAGASSPPFRPLTEAEDVAVVEAINSSGAEIVWVGLGCPKQELWMAAHRGRVNAVMVGVGAAFDFHAGTLRRAPQWMRDSGLEWLHRLLSEPRRLWKRYFVTNTLFIVFAAHQLALRLFGSR